MPDQWERHPLRPGHRRRFHFAMNDQIAKPTLPATFYKTLPK